MERVKKALEKAKNQRESIDDSEDRTTEGAVDIKVSDIQDIEYQKTKVVEVSEDTFKQNRVVSALKEHENADLFKILRTKILHRMRANNWNVLAITSPGKGAGKSMIASNLAISMAMDANHSVLLVDLDFRRPSIHKYFGLPGDVGIRDYLEDDKPLTDLLIHPGLESLVVLPAGKAIRHSSELLSTPKMQELAKELKHRYPDRIVIIDLPPILHTDDAMVFMPNVDASVLVVEEGVSTEDEIKRSLQLLDEDKLMGTILNKSDDKSQMGEYY